MANVRFNRKKSLVVLFVLHRYIPSKLLQIGQWCLGIKFKIWNVNRRRTPDKNSNIRMKIILELFH